LLFSNPNGGLKMAIGLSVEGLPRPFELHGWKWGQNECMLFWELKCLLTSLPVLLNSTIPQRGLEQEEGERTSTVSGPACTRTHEHTIHWIPVMTQLWMNLNRVNIWFDLGNLFCKK
jgi:hypothetical protein